MRLKKTDNNDLQRREKVSGLAPHLAVLALATLAMVALCVFMTVPFLPALAWALALAIIAHPLHRWLAARLTSADLAAGLAAALVVTFLVLPTYLALARMATEAKQAGEAVDREATAGAVGDALGRVPMAKEAVRWVQEHLDEEEIRNLIMSRAGDFTAVLQGSVWAAFQMLAMVFVLFYFFRDGKRLMAGLRELSPLSPRETERLSVRVEDSIHATVYGTIATGMLQGVTGGLLFWALGLPAPVLWGTIMFVLGVIPLVGAVFVWLPASVYLVLEGRYGAAALLVAWGTLMAGPICSFVYGRCAGDRMRMHPVPTLFAYLGGLAVFGATGMVLGPVALALTMGLIDVWRGRIVPERPAIHQESAEPARPGAEVV
jgi:predicted PurR-regulated permease PerM